VVSLLGYEPQTNRCIVCERPLVPNEPVRFDTQAGGVACTRCRPAGRLVDPATRAELRAMVGGSVPHGPLENPALHRALLRAFLETHLQHDRPFRSLELFLDHAGTTDETRTEPGPSDAFDPEAGEEPRPSAARREGIIPPAAG
jgi:recombinational DNA repair protein (RecF pathway)